MRPILFLLLLLNSSSVLAQSVATTFDKMETDFGIAVSYLDSLYHPAAHADAELGVFKDEQNAFLKEYSAMHVALGKHLFRNDWTWNRQIKLFTRVYFNKDGGIDYFLINPQRADLSKEQSDRFFELTQEFISSYSISMSAELPFSQCSPVTYAPSTSNKESK